MLSKKFEMFTIWALLENSDYISIVNSYNFFKLSSWIEASVWRLLKRKKYDRNVKMS